MEKNKLETAATEREEMEALEARAEDEDGEAAEPRSEERRVGKECAA